MKRLIALTVLTLGFVFNGTPCHAAVIIYSGSDPGVAAGGARPNSDAARSAFLTAIGTPQHMIDFEGLPTGFSNPLSPAPGVSISFSNVDSLFTGVSNQNSTNLGYNTTLGGSQHLRLGPNFGSDGIATFNFDSPISAFGAYFTGVALDLGLVRVQFNDGSAQDFSLNPGGPGGGVLFWGFTSFGNSINSVSIRSDSINSGLRDIIGIDDVVTASAVIPEPATFAVFGLMAAGALGLRRRKKASA
jgi:hypothetical protein